MNRAPTTFQQSTAVSFVFVFACGFLLGGFFILPYVPPFPDRPVSAFEAAYWYDNWPGLILGLLLGAISARQALKSRDGKSRKEGDAGEGRA